MELCYAFGMRTGRPPIYTNAKDMQNDVDAYFDKIESQDVDTVNRKHPTVTGLALALGMVRTTLIEYEKNGDFSDTVKRAKARVEEYVENSLYSGQVTGCIFNLKNNFGWEDKTTTDLNAKVGYADLVEQAASSSE